MLAIKFIRWCGRQLEEYKGWIGVAALAVILGVIADIIFDLLSFFSS